MTRDHLPRQSPELQHSTRGWLRNRSERLPSFVSNRIACKSPAAQLRCLHLCHFEVARTCKYCSVMNTIR
jgi:hypothetical protein